MASPLDDPCEDVPPDSPPIIDGDLDVESIPATGSDVEEVQTLQRTAVGASSSSGSTAVIHKLVK